jgi:predicted TIM-barrel fold metal-dependent hydrolase
MTFKHEDFKFIDMHTHFFPPNIFKAIWNYFETYSHTGIKSLWKIGYKLSTEDLVNFLKNQNVEAFTTYNYAHKEGIADYINEWTYNFVRSNRNAIPFGCVWPEDVGRLEYIRKIFDDYDFFGIKIQPLVQNFYPNDARMHEIYDLILDRGKWICFHAGTAPYPNKYVGYANFKKFIDKYPDIHVIVAHMGAFEYKEFLFLAEKHENLYLDTTMIYIPDNIFPERKVKRPKPEDLIVFQDKIFFGSDFPNIPYEYRRSTKGLLELNLPKTFYKKIFYENAKRIFKK